MKLLLDTCVWGGARKDLEDFGEIAIVHGTPHFALRISPQVVRGLEMS